MSEDTQAVPQLIDGSQTADESRPTAQSGPEGRGGQARGRGRKLRTPFRRRRSDAPAPEAGPTVDDAPLADVGTAEEADQTFSYLDLGPKTAHRLVTYLTT